MQRGAGKWSARSDLNRPCSLATLASPVGTDSRSSGGIVNPPYAPPALRSGDPTPNECRLDSSGGTHAGRRLGKVMERPIGFEPTTFSLGS